MWKEIKTLIAQWMLGKALDLLPDGYFKTEYAKFIRENIKYL